MSVRENSPASRGIIRPLLWLLLVISAVGNIITSTVQTSVLIHLVSGLLTLGFGTALVVHHFRTRRS